jgi:GYD domain
MVEALGGKLESFYFAFGDVDAYVTVELPDNEAATAVALAVNGSGGATVKRSVEEVAAEQFGDRHQPEAAFAEAFDDSGKSERSLGMVAAVMHQDDRPRPRRTYDMRLHSGHGHVMIVAGVEGPEDCLEVASNRGFGDPSINQTVGRAEKTRLETGRLADAAIRRRELTEPWVVRVVEGVVSDLIAVEEDFPHQHFASHDVSALLEEGGAGTEAVEGFEDRRRLSRARTVVEGKRDLPGCGGPFRDDAAGMRSAPDRFAAQPGGGPPV